MLVQVEASNKLALALKEKKKLEEKEQDDAIFRYNKDKQQREYEAQMEAQRIQNEKEKETQKLRDQQEKASNRQEEIDMVRAKRAFEQSERDARAREKLAQDKKLRLLADLDVARQRQFADKENLLATQAASERDQFLNIIKA